MSEIKQIIYEILKFRNERDKYVIIDDFAIPWKTHDKNSKIPKGYVKCYELA